MIIDNHQFNAILLEWSAVFARRSIHDFLVFAHQNNLSMPQINILLRLYYSGAATIADLRKEFYGSRAAASQMIDDLVRSGWVERVEAETDRRLKVVSLTAAGRDLVEKGIAARRKWMLQLAESFSPEQRQNIQTVLEIMVEKARELEQKGTSTEQQEM